MEKLQVGRLSITWLRGGCNHIDAGATFGVVPKPLWEKTFPINERHQIMIRTDPMLIQVDGRNILVDAGIGNDRYTQKQMRNSGVTEESSVDQCLQELGLTREEIDTVLMTHLHADHACGLVSWQEGQLVPTFPSAVHYVSHIEWEEMRQPTLRTKGTYWPENWQPIQHLVRLFEEQVTITEEISLIHTGGHSAGHALVLLQSEDETAIHLGDVLPTHAHKNPLWIMAYDDYPIDSIAQKQKWLEKATAGKWWILFYHDTKYRAVKWDHEGQLIEELLLQEA